MAGEYVKIFVDCLETWEPLTNEQAGELLRGLLQYKRSGGVPTLSDGPRFLFPTEKAKIDRDSDLYKSKCDKNRQNGSKGGRPSKTEKNPKKPFGFSETQKTQEKEEEKDKDKEKDLYTPPPPSKSTVQLAENVSMSNDEYKKLLAAHGPADTARLIEILDNYKGSSGKKYKSDYRAILSWCLDRLQEEKKKSGGNVFLDMLREEESHGTQ